MAGFRHSQPRLDLWARLDRKLRDFGMFDAAFAAPDNLADYYRRRWAREIPGPPPSKLKVGLPLPSTSEPWNLDGVMGQAVSVGGRSSRRPSRAVGGGDGKGGSGRPRPDSPLDVDRLIEEAVSRMTRKPKKVVEPVERLASAVKLPKIGSLDLLYEEDEAAALLHDWPSGLNDPAKEAYFAKMYGLPV